MKLQDVYQDSLTPTDFRLLEQQTPTFLAWMQRFGQKFVPSLIAEFAT